MQIDWRKELARDGHKVVLSGRPIAMHCHHYNINLQKTLEDSLGDQGVRLLYESAEKATNEEFRAFMDQYPMLRTAKSRLELAASVYQHCGLGVIRFLEAGIEGGRAESPSSHFVTGWLAKHGRRKIPGCHFTRGWLAGVLEAVLDRPTGYFKVEEEACKTVGARMCEFNITVA